jgi:hypothetical protein
LHLWLVLMWLVLLWLVLRRMVLRRMEATPPFFCIVRIALGIPLWKSTSYMCCNLG